MTKKIFLTSAVTICMIAPVMAEPINNPDIFPSGVEMQTDNTNTTSASDLGVAVVNIDKIQTDAKVLEDLPKQQADFEAILKLSGYGVGDPNTFRKFSGLLGYQEYGIVGINATKASDLGIAIVSIDKIQTDAEVLEDLHQQRTDFENALREKLEKEQKEIEKEKANIEKSQDSLSKKALQKRVAEYQKRVKDFQHQISESAQSIETSYQNALNEIKKEHLDPIIQNIIIEKNLSLVIDGRTAHVGKNVKDLDITNEVIDSLNKKVSSVKMEKPKGL